MTALDASAMLAYLTGEPGSDAVEQALERDRFMSPAEAKEWGLIDEILEARGKAEPEK